MDLCYEQVGNQVAVTAHGTPNEIAGLVAALQDRQKRDAYALIREPYQRHYSMGKKGIARKEVKPCPNWSADPMADDQGDHAWRRFELHFTAGPERDELYQLLDRLHLSRRELALIALGLRVRPGFSLDDFGT